MIETHAKFLEDSDSNDDDDEDDDIYIDRYNSS
jgi:hypothetical protein